jgi:hypothetical protein
MPMHHSRQKQYFMRKKYEEYEAKATVVFQFEILREYDRHLAKPFLWNLPVKKGLGNERSG